MRNSIKYISGVAKLYYKLASSLIDINEHKKNHPEIFEQMERIDRENFDEAYGPAWAQSSWDIKDDHKQPGTRSFGILDDSGNLRGYMYGYDCNYEDDFEEGDVDQIRWYSEPIPLSKLESLSNEGKIFYIANLAIDKSFRGDFLKLAINFKKTIKSANYEYVAMAALSESYKLFFDNGEPREKVLKLFGMKPVAALPTEDQTILLFKVI